MATLHWRGVCCGAGMFPRQLALLASAIALLAVACADQSEESGGPGAAIYGGTFHLGEAGGVEPTINVDLGTDGSFEWRTDPGRYGDWVPSGSGVWSQAGEIITLRPKSPDRSMPFSATLGSALYPSPNVVEANLHVVGSSALVTASVKKENGTSWSPPNGADARQITWERGRACTSSGRSNGCN
jgi:hypothetical protein